MKIIKSRCDYKIVYQNSNRKNLLAYIALGFFDGVHLGHQALLKLCVEKAEAAHAISTVILFNPHPDKVIYRLHSFYLLTPLKEKIERMKQLGIQQVIIIDFTDEFQKITAENFITQVLIEKFNMEAVFVGYNYHFGFQKRGDSNLIKRLSRDYHFKSYIMDPKLLNGKQKISSTIIKELLKKGDVEKANQLLGYHYQLTGKVIHGEKRGNAVLSFPTANVDITQEKLLPGNGVYIAFAHIKGKRYHGLVNIGHNPTFGQKLNRVSVEIYIFDFNDDIYNRKISISLLKKIRDEKIFDDTGDLILQIKKDKIIADVFFQEYDFGFINNYNLR